MQEMNTGRGVERVSAAATTGGPTAGQAVSIVRTLAQQRSTSLTALNELNDSGASQKELDELSKKLQLSRPRSFCTFQEIPSEWLEA